MTYSELVMKLCNVVCCGATETNVSFENLIDLYMFVMAHEENDDPNEHARYKKSNRPVGEEKLGIYNRLRAYRDRHGLGSLAAVSDATGHAISTDELRGMINGGKYEIADWRKVSLALEKLERKSEA